MVDVYEICVLLLRKLSIRLCFASSFFSWKIVIICWYYVGRKALFLCILKMKVSRAVIIMVLSLIKDSSDDLDAVSVRMIEEITYKAYNLERKKNFNNFYLNREYKNS